MKKFVTAASLAAGIAVLAAGAMPVLAQQQQDRHAQPMTRADVVAKVQQRFALVDANHDGVVTKAEFDAYRTKAQADREAKRAAHRDERFAALDTNHDGQISRAEFAARSDRGPDGEGMRGHGGPGGGPGGHGGMHHRGGMGGWGGWGGPNGDKRADAFFAAMDANHDGKVTLAEATAKPLAMFDKADTNHDGTVTPAERHAARQAMRAGWQAKN